MKKRAQPPVRKDPKKAPVKGGDGAPEDAAPNEAALAALLRMASETVAEQSQIATALLAKEEQEKLLRTATRNIRGSAELKRYLRSIALLPRIDPEEEKRLANQIRAGDGKALNRLVEANVRFVVSHAKRYRGCGLSFEDLICEGNIGLLEAARRFDPEKNVKFITYAVWWIRQAIIHALMETAFLVRVPHKPAQFLRKIRAVEETLARELKREPTDEEVAERMEQSVEDVRETIANIHDTVSLDDVIDVEHDFHLEDKIAAAEPTGDEHIRKRQIRERLRMALKRLNEKEEQVLRLRFGVGNDTGLTLKEIGEKLGLSRERIRQIEAQALQKLHDTDYNEELAELNDAL